MIRLRVFFVFFFGQNTPEMILCLLSASYQGVHDVDREFVAPDVHLDHFIKVVSAKFFYSKLLFFPCN